MTAFSSVNNLLAYDKLRRSVMTLVAGLMLLLATTACTPADTAAVMPVPEATAADVQRAQDNLSSESVNVDTLSRQSPQEKTGGTGLK